MPDKVSWVLASVDAAVAVFYVLLIVAAIYLIYRLAKWLKSLYTDFTGPNPFIEQQITNMFTPHQDDGSVAPKDIAPKGVDPVDWLFMNHDLSEAI